MSDEHDGSPQDELTPEQESTVRRLLSEARHDQPLPADVAERLDRVLADLSQGAPAAPVVDLAARRRRRNAGRLLVAAAAVILAGVGVGQVIGNTDTADDAGGSAADSSSLTEQAPDRQSEDDHSQDEAVPAPEGDAGGGAGSSTAAEALGQVLPLDLTSQRLALDVQDQLSALPSATRSDLIAPAPASGANLLATTAGFSCDQPDPTNKYAADELLPAYYDGVPVVVALKAEAGGTQSGELLACGTGASVASFSIALP